jgi:structural maintenance of chromosome 1
VASRSPKGLTELFEHISGSEVLRKDYEKLEAAKNSADEKTSFIFARKKTLAAEKRAKKEQKEEAEKHLRQLQELVCAHARKS